MGKALDAREFFDRLRQFPDLDVGIKVVSTDTGLEMEIREVSCDEDSGGIIVYAGEKEDMEDGEQLRV